MSRGHEGRVPRNFINNLDFERGYRSTGTSYLSYATKKLELPLNFPSDNNNTLHLQSYDHNEQLQHQSIYNYDQQQHQQFSAGWGFKNETPDEESNHGVPRSRSPITRIRRDRPGDELSTPFVSRQYKPSSGGQAGRGKGKGKKKNKQRAKGQSGNKDNNPNMMPIYHTRRNQKKETVSSNKVGYFSVPPPANNFCETAHLDAKKKELFQKNWYVEYYNFGHSSHYLQHRLLQRQQMTRDHMQIQDRNSTTF